MISHCHLVFQSPPASLASRHVEDLFSPLVLCSQVASVRCCPPLSKLVNYTGKLARLDFPLAPLYQLAKVLLSGLYDLFLCTLWQSPLFLPPPPFFCFATLNSNAWANRYEHTSRVCLWGEDQIQKGFTMTNNISHHTLLYFLIHLLISWQTVQVY